jgi:hypothetical protein
MGCQDIADLKTLEYLADIIENVPQSSRKPFRLVKDKEFEPEYKGFLLRIMKLDLRERPSADELIRDAWFG